MSGFIYGGYIKGSEHMSIENERYKQPTLHVGKDVRC